MKRLRYIVMVVLSLLIVYSGVGVSVCNCFTCEVACGVCSTPCSGCEHDEDGDAACHDQGCTVSIYKINLAQQSTSPLVSVSSFALFCELLPDFQSVLPDDETEMPYVVPPPAVSSRHILALHSTLLI